MAGDGGRDRDRTCDPYHVNEARGAEMKEFQRLNAANCGPGSPDVPGMFANSGSVDLRALPTPARSAVRACDVVQRDDGRFAIGLHDESSGFETRTFTASVLALERPPPLIHEYETGPVGAEPVSNPIADHRSHNNQPQQHTRAAVRLPGRILPEGQHAYAERK